jgi:hypothetical protein
MAPGEFGRFMFSLRTMPVGPIDAFWHLLNFFAPAIGVGVLAPLLAKIVWRRALQGVAWRRLAGWGTAASALTWVVALVVFGRDGRMASYGALVCASAVSLWWLGFGARAR